MAERLTNTGEVQPSNRAARRKNRIGQEASHLRNQWRQLDYEMSRTGDLWEETVGRCENRITQVVYQGEKPFIFGYLDSRRSFHQLLETVHFINLRQPFINIEDLKKADDEDLFLHRVGGLTLSDVEQMPLPLSTDDVRKINRMLRHSRFTRESNQDLLVRYSMVYLAAWPFAKSEEKHQIPANLLALNKRITEYFDYYSDILINFPALSEGEQADFLLSLLLTGSWLVWGIGCYLPASRGISPSSAVKLYHQFAGESPFWKWSLRNVVNALSDESRYAYRKDALPEDLKQYLYYNPQADQRASALLVNHYVPEHLGNNERVRAHEVFEQLLARFAPYHKRLSGELSRAVDRRLLLTFEPDHVISKVTVTNQNRQTLMFILHFKDGETHLTLEFNRDGRLYGMPPKLVEKYPHLADLLLGDVLTRFLGEVGKRYPELEKKEVVPYFSKPLISQYEPRPLKDILEKVSTPKKVRRMPLAVFPKEPELPQKPDVKVGPRFFVSYTQDEVNRLMGGRPRPNDVRRVLAAISRFELMGNAKTITWSGGQRTSLVLGDLRIILNHLDGVNFVVEAIGDRKHIYNKYADRSGRFNR